MNRNQSAQYYILIIFLITSVVTSENILFLCGMPSPSHHIWNKSIMKALADRGHNLTILSPENDKSTKNMHFIYMEGIHETIHEHFMVDFVSSILNFQTTNYFKTIEHTYEYYNVTDWAITRSNGFQVLQNYPNTFKFDLIIHDFTIAQILLGFVDKFGYPPLISISAFNIPPHTYAVSSQPVFPSYAPHIVTTYSANMTFYDRVINLLCHIYEWYNRHYIHMPKGNELARTLFGDNLPSLESIEQRTELVLVNVDFTIEYPQLLPANVIPVGGLQVKREEEIPDEIQKFLNKSTAKGVVLFSLGTNMKSVFLGSNNTKIFIDVFRDLPEYDFIWKYEGDDLIDLPPNLLCIKWLPQNSILAHPKVKLFISHGGLLSTQESIWHGVPILGIPLFVDQHQNMFKVMNGGIGKLFPFDTLSFSNLRENIIEMLENSQFKDKVSRRSKQFRNQQMHPLDRAIFWIEYIMQNGGEHLRLPTTNMSFYQIYMLDVLAVIILIIYFLSNFLLSKTTKYISRKSRNKKKQH